MPVDDPIQRCPDISQAEQLLKWQPKTPLRAGLKRTIEYFDGLLTQLGDIRNTETGCPASGMLSAKATAIIKQPSELIMDAAGGFWMFVGTQSSFAGRHELYVVRVHLGLIQQ